MPLPPGTDTPAASPAGLDGKPAVLFFFKTTCPTCALAFPYLDKLERAFGEDDVQVLAVSQERDTLAAEFAARCAVGVPIHVDTGLVASHAYEVDNVPTLFLLDSYGKVRETLIGHDKEGINRVAAMLAEWAEIDAPIVAADDDGAPAMQPG